MNNDTKIVKGYIIPTKRTGKWDIKFVGNEVEQEVFLVPIDWVQVSGVRGNPASRCNFVIDVLDEKEIGVMKVVFPELNANGSEGPALVEIYRAKRKEN